MWKPGEIVVCRGIYRGRIWHAMPTFAVKDTVQELILALTPGAAGMVEEHYAAGVKNGKRRWDFQHEDWSLGSFVWRTNRLLLILEPEKFYSTDLFWNHERNEFLGYYINFQLPFTASHCGIDSLDLELDLVIHPDLSFEWKDLDDYKRGLETGIILPEWTAEIETAKIEVLNHLEKRRYPFDGSWLDWIPDPCWSLPTLPEGWDKV